MDTMTVALTSVVVVGATSIAGIIASAVNGRADRQHARQMAHDGRTYDSRRDAYVNLVKHLQLLNDWLALTEPLMTVQGMPTAPDISTDETEGRQRLANLTVFASREVYDASVQCTKLVAEFRIDLNFKRTMQQQIGGPSAASDPRVTEIAMRMHARRDEYRAKLERVEGLIRDEMARPESTRRPARSWCSVPWRRRRSSPVTASDAD